MSSAAGTRLITSRVVDLLAAVLALAVLIFGAPTASALDVVGPQNAVGPQTSNISASVELPDSVTAGQGRVSTTLYGQIASATGVAANNGARAADDLPTCFVAGTLVLTEDGPRPIEEIEVGDRVWSKDLATGENVLRVVDKTFVRHADQLVHLTIDGDTLTTTGEHPFWVDGRGWVNAGDLKPGDVLVTPDGVATLDRKLVEQRGETVYNFRVPGLHDYYAIAGGTPVLVHNADYSGVTHFVDGDSFIHTAGSLEAMADVRVVDSTLHLDGLMLFARGGNGLVSRA